MESNKDDTQEKDSQGGGISIKRLFEYFTIISLVALVFSLTIMLIFSITYANEYKVPLSMYFSNFWLFGYMFASVMFFGLISPMFSVIIYHCVESNDKTWIQIVFIFIVSVILAKVSISFYCVVYIFPVLWVTATVLYYFIKLYKRKEECYFFIFSMCIAPILVYIIALVIFGLEVPNPNWTYFCIYITLSLAVTGYPIIKFFTKKITFSYY